MKLTHYQLAALDEFRRRNGRSWKYKLQFCWDSGLWAAAAQMAALQQLRNTLGPTWLKAYRVGDTSAGVLQYSRPTHIEPGYPNWRIVSAERSDPLTDLAAGYGTMKTAKQYAKRNHITLVEDRP